MPEKARIPAKKFVSLMMNHTPLQRGLDALKDMYSASDISDPSSKPSLKLGLYPPSASVSNIGNHMNRLYSQSDSPGDLEIDKSYLSSESSEWKWNPVGGYDGLMQEQTLALECDGDEKDLPTELHLPDRSISKAPSRQSHSGGELMVSAARLQRMLLELGLEASAKEVHLMLAEAFVNSNDCEVGCLGL